MKPHFSLILWCMRNCAAGREDALFDPPPLFEVKFAVGNIFKS